MLLITPPTASPRSSTFASIKAGTAQKCRGAATASSFSATVTQAWQEVARGRTGGADEEGLTDLPLICPRPPAQHAQSRAVSRTVAASARVVGSTVDAARPWRRRALGETVRLSSFPAVTNTVSGGCPYLGEDALGVGRGPIRPTPWSHLPSHWANKRCRCAAAQRQSAPSIPPPPPGRAADTDLFRPASVPQTVVREDSRPPPGAWRVRRWPTMPNGFIARR